MSDKIKPHHLARKAILYVWAAKTRSGMSRSRPVHGFEKGRGRAERRFRASGDLGPTLAQIARRQQRRRRGRAADPDQRTCEIEVGKSQTQVVVRRELSIGVGT